MCDSLEELLSTSDIVTLHVPVLEGHQAPGRRRVPRPDEAGRDPAEHLARRRRRRGRAARRRSTPARSGPASTCSPTSRARGQGAWESPLAQHPNVVATHHIGASTEQAQRAIAAGVVEIVDAFAAGEARNCVNLDPEPARRGHPDRPPPRPGGRAGAGARPAEHGRPQRRAHGEPRLPRRRGRRRVDRRGRTASDGLLADLRAIPHVLGVSEATLGDDAAGGGP